MDSSFLTLYTQDVSVLKFTAAIVAEKNKRDYSFRRNTETGITINVRGSARLAAKEGWNRWAMALKRESQALKDWAFYW